jgi:glucokinase
MTALDAPKIMSSSSIMKSKLPALGIDLGGTKLSAAVIADTKIISEEKKVPTPHGSEAIIQAILGLIEHFQKEHVLTAVGIATAGIVNPNSGQVIGSTGNIPGWAGTQAKKLLEERCALAVHVENDANAAAYGESVAAGLLDKTCTITVTLGTGIGVGIMINGKLYRGSHWAAGEGGHMRIALDNQRLCTCGLWDCWEAYGSGRGLVATAEILANASGVPQSSMLSAGKPITTQAIFEAQTKNDPLAAKIIHQWHEHITAGLTNLAHILDPDCFIVSGGLSKFVDYELLKEMFTDRSMPSSSEHLNIHRSTLGTAAGMVGAACLALDSLTTNQQ